MRLKIIALIIITLLITTLPEIASSISGLKFPDKEETVMQIGHSNGSVGTRISRVYDKGSTYAIKTIEEDGSTSKMVLEKWTLRPLSYKQTDRSGKTIQFTKYYKNNKMYLAIPESDISKMVSIPDNAYDMHSLYYVFRRFPFDKDEININLVMHDPGNIRNTKMYVKNLGIEEVKALSGTFKCYKLEMGCANPIERVFWPHQYYFWFTQEAPHYFVKFEGRDTDLSVVTNELMSYKVGKEYLVKIPAQ